jgi:plasmid maintenance system antidote protein VapI
MASRKPRLTYADAIAVWLMRWAGTYQHDIAAHFGVNQGRISEILNGQRWPGSETSARSVS